MQLDWVLKNKLELAGLRVVKLLKLKGFRVLFVGGIVRDHILKRTSDNLDIATDAHPSQVEKILKAHRIHTKEVGKKFGTILAIVDRFRIEITTFRAEGWYSDRRHPDQVKFISDYKQDAKRRDFTINALYFDPIKKELHDPMSGIKDLRSKIIRFVGDPKKRIDEDPLRMLRGVRLAAQLRFRFEKNSFAAIKTRAKLIQSVSGERIKAELDKILLIQPPSSDLEMLDASSLLQNILPEISALKVIDHRMSKVHLEGNMFNHTLLALDQAEPFDNLDLLYAILFHDIGKLKTAVKRIRNGEKIISTPGHAKVSSEMFLPIAKRLKFSRNSKNLIAWAIKNHMKIFHFAHIRSEKQLALALHSYFPFLILLGRADNLGTLRLSKQGKIVARVQKGTKLAQKLLDKIKLSGNKFVKLANGDLIMKYSKLKPGKQLGQKIQEIKVQIVLGKIKNLSDFKSYLTS